jgi:hypothetical protein
MSSHHPKRNRRDSDTGLRANHADGDGLLDHAGRVVQTDPPGRVTFDLQAVAAVACGLGGYPELTDLVATQLQQHWTRTPEDEGRSDD